MNTNNIIGNEIGLIHLIASVVALIAGTLILFLTKGTQLHKRIGYTYVTSMTILLITAFMIYRLFGTWGVFHWTALISTLTLICGLVPILTRRPTNNYISLHFSFMYWSVIGLYGCLLYTSDAADE